MSFIRKCGLIVYGSPPIPGGTGIALPEQSGTGAPGNPITVSKQSPAASQNGLDLSNLRIQFKVEAMDVDVPPIARIRVLNPSTATAKRIRKEFQGVLLQAGYEDGGYGVIFQGSIIRARRGKIDNKNTFVDILASNLDAVYNFGFVNTTLKAGASLSARANAIQSSVNSSSATLAGPAAFQAGLQYGNIPDSFNTGGTLPRGKVLFGLARDHLSDIAATTGCSWSVGVDGKVNFIPLDGYLPDEAVVFTDRTGLIRVPEATPQGIKFSVLLNPRIKIGTRVQLNNASITTTTNKQNVGFPAYSDFQFFANTSNDGFYKVLVAEHEGDTRGVGDDWRTDIIALSIDQSASANAGAPPVRAYG